MSNSLSVFQDHMRNKRLESIGPTTKAPDLNALKKRSGEYAKKEDIEKLASRLYNLSEKFSAEMTDMMSVISEAFGKLHNDVSGKSKDSLQLVRSEYLSKIKKVEETVAYLENDIKRVKASSASNLKINLPVQRQLSIPVAVDEGGTGQTNNNIIYLGGGLNTDGAWRFSISGNNLVVERRESGVWVEKSAFLAS